MEYKLSDLFALQMGKTPARDEPRYWQNGRHSWISIADLSSVDKFIEETKESISDCAIKESNISMIPEGTVVMSFKLSLGKVAITKKAMYSNEAIMAFIPRAGVDISTDYLYYLLKARRWDTGGNKAVKGITLNKATLSGVKVCVHSAEEQRQIVNILDKLNSVINRRQAQLAKLDDLVKCRFVEMFRTCTTVKTIKECQFFISDGNYSSKYPRSEEFVSVGVPFIRANNIKNGTVTDDELYYITESKHSILRKGHLRANDLLITTRGNIGQTALVPSRHQDSNINAQIVLIRIMDGRMNPIYLRETLNTSEVQGQIKKLETGTALKQLPVGNLLKIKIKVPDLTLQNAFATFVRRIDKLRFVIQQSLDETQKLFDSLMQEYFD